MGREFFRIHFLQCPFHQRRRNDRRIPARRHQRANQSIAQWIGFAQTLRVAMATQLGRFHHGNLGCGPGGAGFVKPPLKQIGRHLTDAPPLLCGPGFHPPVKIVWNVDGRFHQRQVSWFPVSGQAWIASFWRKMDHLFRRMPEHRDKEFQGMVAYVEGGAAARQAVLAQGWHLVHVGGDLFEMKNPPGFVPQIYRANAV